MSEKPIVYFSRLGDQAGKLVDTMLPEEIHEALLLPYRAIFIRDDNHCTEIVRYIKQSQKEQVYLKPLYIYRDHPQSNSQIDTVVDGIVTDEKVEDYYTRYRSTIDTIHSHIERLLPYTQIQHNEEYNLELKIVRHLYSRTKPLSVIFSSQTLYGYTYPLVDILLGEKSYQEFILIDFLKNRKLVDGSFVDKVHHCPHCYSAYLNFREVCVKCGSSNIRGEDLIHHYRCGYEGPESDYVQGREEVCPKCHRVLKQIGVDFDRPAQVFSCNDCNQIFQEPDVDVFCINCGKITEVEKVLKRTIEEYRLTALGENSAVNGILFNLQDELRGTLDLVDEAVFRKLLSVEVSRIKRYNKSVSSLIRLSFTNYIELASLEGEDLEKLNHEIGKAISDLIRTSDMVSFMNSTVMLMLFTETDYQWSRHAVNRIVQSLSDLVQNSIGKELKITTKVIEISGEDGSDTLIDKIMDNG